MELRHSQPRELTWVDCLRASSGGREKERKEERERERECVPPLLLSADIFTNMVDGKGRVVWVGASSGGGGEGWGAGGRDMGGGGGGMSEKQMRRCIWARWGKGKEGLKKKNTVIIIALWNLHSNGAKTS